MAFGDSEKQPAGRMVGVPNYKAGGPRSVSRLKHLNFDPIGELVDTYRKIQAELVVQEKIRDGDIIQLTSQGKPRAYRPEVHHALFDKLTNIGEKLLRYGYGRVPEQGIQEEKPKPSFVVNLTRKGEQYVVSEPDDVPFRDDMPDDLEDMP